MQYQEGKDFGGLFLGGPKFGGGGGGVWYSSFEMKGNLGIKSLAVVS